MMVMRSVFFVILATLVPAYASAASPPVNILFAGTIVREYLGQGAASWCLFEGTNSTFVKKNNIRLVSFPDITINVPNAGSDTPTVYTVGGQARLSFNQGDPTAGTITFVGVAGYPAGVNAPTFDQYQESYNTANNVAKVSYTIHFPSCTLSVSATYRN